jgi:methionine aminopeptidase
MCKAGANVHSLVVAGDRCIEEGCGRIFKNKKGMAKGIAFPTCISKNSIVGHFSPVTDGGEVLKAGDMVKIDLGCHIDGYPAVVAATFAIVAEGADAKIMGKAADVFAAAHTAVEVRT